MSCGLGQDKLDVYVDGHGPEAELAATELHLRTCSACAAEALGRMQLKRMTQAAAQRYTPSPEFRLRLEANIAKKRRLRWALLWRPQIAAAAFALLVIAVFTGMWVRHAARARALAELLDLHVTTLASANPVDVISTDRHTVKPWFQGKLPFTFNLPELQGSPFVLLGGKLVYFDGNPGAQLLFRTGKHEVSVFIVRERPVAMPAAAGASPARESGFNLETWSAGGLSYIAVSDASASDLHALGELLRAAGRS
jgi:anti-sigma factor RsiW